MRDKAECQKIRLASIFLLCLSLPVMADMQASAGGQAGFKNYNLRQDAARISKHKTARLLDLRVREQQQQQLRQARSLANSGQQPQALSMLQLEIEKGQLEIYEIYSFKVLIAQIHSSQEQFAQSRSTYQSVYDDNNMPAVLRDRVTYKIGQLAFTMGDYRQAALTLRRWLKNKYNQDKEKAHLILAQSYINLDDDRAAKKALLRWRALHAAEDGDELGFALLGQLYHSQGKLEKAVAALRRYIEQAKKNNRGVEASWLQLMAACYDDLGQTKEAANIRNILKKAEHEI